MSHRPALLALLIVAAASAATANDVSLRGHVRAHDPSSVVREGGLTHVFTTGWGVRSMTSRDLVEWTTGPSLFGRDEIPDWVEEHVPGFRGHCWAPDVVRVGGEYRVYYSVSSFGKQTSAIGLATSPTLDPENPSYGWTDRGAVVTSKEGDPYNAIDPSVLVDDDGRHWMAYGSYWKGIYLVELDPATGLAIAGATRTRLAWAEMIEAATLVRREERYYLFVNHGLCCRGVRSTYSILVGRSDQITGPYVDRDGRALVDGGGALVLDTEGRRIGPGHVAPFADDPAGQFAFHYYDGEDRGRSKLGLAAWEWDSEGWPIATKVQLAGEDTTPRRSRRRNGPDSMVPDEAPPAPALPNEDS